MSQAAEQILSWRKNPVKMVRELFKVEPDEWQKDVLMAFASGEPLKRRISMKACAGPGKSACLAWIGWNFLLCYSEVGHHPNGAAVSISHDNLKDNLWKEFSVWQGRSELLERMFFWTKERIFCKEHPATWWISARTWSKNANPDEQGRALSGLHSKYILYLIDESGDINPTILKSAEQGLSNCTFGKIVQAGNPTSEDGMLYQAATKLRDQWFNVSITGDPDDPKRSKRIDAEWARTQIQTYGKDDPWVMAYILGQFPKGSLEGIISVEEVEAAMARKLRPDSYSWAQKRLGIDVARTGGDPTVISPRQGLQAFLPVIMRHRVEEPVSVDIANRVVAGKLKWQSELEFFDDTVGWAHGAIDVMRGYGYSPIPILFSSKATDPGFFNKRSEMLHAVVMWIKSGGALPYSANLIKQITSVRWGFKNGRRAAEEKDQIKTRIKMSTDEYDALGLTFAIPDCPAQDSFQAMMSGQGKMLSEYDPFDPKRI